MNEGYYITSTGGKYKLISDYYVYLGSSDIIELFIPDGVKEVDCFSNKLTELIIPDGVIHIYCDNNQLTKLDIPDSVKFIECSENDLTELIVPDDCIVDCDNTVKVITRTMYNRSKRLKTILK